jgi:hypothetical protein
MASKKLEVELKVDNSDAKKKAKEVAETAAGAAGGAADSGVADNAGKAAKSLQDLSNGAKEANGNMKSAIKGFAGMAIGLAASYAASKMEPGSLGQRAVGAFGTVASSAMTGAMLGSAAPGVGTAAGAAVGAGIGAAKAAVDWSAEDDAVKKAKDEQMRSIETWERVRKQTREFRELLEGLTKTETDASERLARINEELQTRREFESNVAQTQRHAVATGNEALLAEATEKRQRNAAEIDALESVLKQMEKPKTGGGAADWNGVDALSAVGGMFAGSGAGARALDDIAASSAETVKVLKEIERNTDNGGGATWQ